MVVLGAVTGLELSGVLAIRFALDSPLSMPLANREMCLLVRVQRTQAGADGLLGLFPESVVVKAEVLRSVTRVERTQDPINLRNAHDVSGGGTQRLWYVRLQVT